MDYSKYIRSTGTHYISNSGSDERGKLHGGTAGDQTGKEWQLRSWYNRPWSHVLRWKDQTAALKMAELACAAALNDKIGYDQYQRTTYWKQLEAAGYDPSAIKTACESDCTSGVAANCKAVGYLLGIPALKSLAIDTYSSNMRSRFKAAGFEVLTASKYRSGKDYLLPGDVLLYEGHHAAMNITLGSKAGAWKPERVPEVVYALGERLLKNGFEGEDVRQMQTLLIQLGYDCGKWGADGDFGDCTEMAVEKFQRDHDCDPDGEYGPITHAAMMDCFGTDDDGSDEMVRIFGGNCFVRDAPNTGGAKLGVAAEGETYRCLETSDNGWHKIVWRTNQNGWVSGKYSGKV